VRRITIIAAVAAVTFAIGMPVARAADKPVPSSDVCSQTAPGETYACMSTAKRAVPSGDPVIFAGTLSPKARKALAKWTKGDNIVCLTRYQSKPDPNGGWAGTTLEAACTTVRNDGGFTIDAEFGRKGRFFYGLEMGPCRADEALCGGGDAQLIGLYNKGDKAIVLRTT
jgi:hypothetical protein